jgi:hypothetical protein
VCERERERERDRDRERERETEREGKQLQNFILQQKNLRILYLVEASKRISFKSLPM